MSKLINQTKTNYSKEDYSKQKMGKPPLIDFCLPAERVRETTTVIPSPVIVKSYSLRPSSNNRSFLCMLFYIRLCCT